MSLETNRQLAEALAVMEAADYALLRRITRYRQHEPDLSIMPDGKDVYLFRWYIILELTGSVYVHLQVKDDPYPEMHDHPWDNQSVILAGAYLEHLQTFPPYGAVEIAVRQKGGVITRGASEAHKLHLNAPYCLTLFSTGPTVREWGFWHDFKHIPWPKMVEETHGTSRRKIEQPSPADDPAADNGITPVVERNRGDVEAP